MSNEEYHKEKSLKEELAELMLREELFWRDKSKELWIKEGDANTKFFHALMKAKRSRNRIDSILDREGNRHSSLEAIEEVAVNFFKELLGDGSSVNSAQSHFMMDVIHREILDADNKSLRCPFTLEEVKKAVFDLQPNKAPDPDGFTMDFYQKCWGFLEHDILNFLEDFRKQDDTILFGEATPREAYTIKEVLDDNEKVSRQCMNEQKSMIYFLDTSRSIQSKIVGILQFGQGGFPIKNLGVPLFAGRLDNKIWEEIVNKCKAKSAAWMNNWLSQAGCIQMIKSILFAVPIYYMPCYSLSCKAISALDGMLKKFLWEGSKEAKKIPLINWDTACMLKEEGGAGLRKMKLQNLALGAKLAWKMYNTPQKGWYKVMATKYLDSSEPERIFIVANSVGGSPIWKFAWESRKIITDHLTWKVGNGKKAKFWRDS
ncbi:uncharacterized protein LOC131856677 [Cryptomeria japonica]|uniref:uncharacterized protein LOC131856677 n=1 Tax=Cryptomeria japonica TaxID=3369 RepID=UPI0027D9E726|nr:uncharacterized protein LOC131856677 [Cryptomeria japonica]